MLWLLFFISSGWALLLAIAFILVKSCKSKGRIGLIMPLENPKIVTPSYALINKTVDDISKLANSRISTDIPWFVVAVDASGGKKGSLFLRSNIEDTANFKKILQVLLTEL